MSGVVSYLPHDGEEGGRVDDEGAVEAAGVVVGDDLERAHEEVEESRRRPEKACEHHKNPIRPVNDQVPHTTTQQSTLLQILPRLLLSTQPGRAKRGTQSFSPRFKPHRLEADPQTARGKL